MWQKNCVSNSQSYQGGLRQLVWLRHHETKENKVHTIQSHKPKPTKSKTIRKTQRPSKAKRGSISATYVGPPPTQHLTISNSVKQHKAPSQNTSQLQALYTGGIRPTGHSCTGETRRPSRLKPGNMLTKQSHSLSSQNEQTQKKVNKKSFRNINLKRKSRKSTSRVVTFSDSVLLDSKCWISREFIRIKQTRNRKSWTLVVVLCLLLHSIVSKPES